MLLGSLIGTCTHVLNLLRNADLSRIRMQLPDYPHTDPLRAIQVSVEALDERARARYLAVAVLLEHIAVHPAIPVDAGGHIHFLNSNSRKPRLNPLK